MELIGRWLVVTLALMLAAWLIPGVFISGFWVALIAALLLGLVNAVIRPVLIVLTIPITILTLGLFVIVINALMFWLVAAVLPGFTVSGFWPALLAALVVSVVSLLGNSLLHD